jgi:dolichol-phosphate mannosyltransferase
MTSIALPNEMVAEADASANGVRSEDASANGVRSEATPVVASAAPNVFVIPAYNEELNLPRLFVDLEERPELFPPGSRVIVVDDGSQDRTPELVSDYAGPLPVHLLDLGHNQGPGAAFRAGFEAALEHCPDDGFVVTMEADTTSDLDALPQMLERAADGAELVLASWKMHNVTRWRSGLSRAAGFLVRHALGVDAKTVSSFFRVYDAGVLRRAMAHYGDHFVRERGFACKAEILANVARLGARIEEVQVDLDWSRREGESKMPVFRTMLAYWRMLARQSVARQPSA